MKRRLLLILPPIIIAVLLLFFFMQSSVPTQLKPAEPKTLIVPDNFQTIGSAIANAIEGDTILVREGDYSEILTIDKSVTLIGENEDATVIRGQGDLTVVSIVRDGVYISGFTVTTGEKSPKFVSQSSLAQVPYAIALANVSYCNITANSLVDSSCGLLLSNSPLNWISENNMEGNGYGIVLTDSSEDNQIVGNNVTQNKIGVALYGCRNNSLSGNYITGSERSGILMRNSELNKIARNAVANNTYGVLFSVSSNNHIHHNNFIENQNQTDDEGLNASGLPNSIPFSVNVWIDGVEGNYWSDYNGTESYGFEFKPYIIDQNNQDAYPLIEPARIFMSKNSSTALPWPKDFP